MRKSIISIFLICFSFSLCLNASWGIYLSAYNKSNSIAFQTNDKKSSVLDYPYQNGTFSLIFSLYKEKIYEFCMTLSHDKYRISDEYSSNHYGIGFELGKLFSIDFRSKKNQRFIAPDLSAGGYFRLEYLKPEDSIKLCYSYGLFVSLKIKIPLRSAPLKIESIDLGYKFYFPIHFSYQSSEDSHVITGSQMLFLGISL